MLIVRSDKGIRFLFDLLSAILTQAEGVM
jgi:hypothetical protein